MPADTLASIVERGPWVWAGDLVGIALLVVYQLYLRHVCRRQPERTYRGRSNRLRRAWVHTIRKDGRDILAIQTLRNWVMSATLFASTAMLIGLGIVHLALEGPDLSSLSASLSLVPTGASLVRIKLVLLAGFFFGAFLHFALALRYYNHTGFLINLPDEHYPGSALDPVADTLNRAGGHYNQGTRLFILAAPFVLWLIGPDWFLFGIVASLVMLYRFDFRTDE